VGAAVGGGAYLIGPSIADVAADVGIAGTIVVIGLFAATLVVALKRLRGRRAHDALADERGA